MGTILDVPDDEFGLEARDGSFILRTTEKKERVRGDDGLWRNAKPVRWFAAYGTPLATLIEGGQYSHDSVLFNYDDIPALRRALDRIEAHLDSRRGV